MSANEIIEHIKALPPEEQAKVVEFLRVSESSDDPANRKIYYASKEAARAAGEKVLTEHAELFRKLAEYERQESSGRS